MTAATLVQSAVAAGIRIRIDADNIVLSAPFRPDGHLLECLSSAKVEVLRYLGGLARWTENDWNALYEERAGIMEFDGGLARLEAEARAEAEVNLVRMLVRSGDG